MNCELKLKCIKISSKVKAKGTSLGSEDALELLRQPEHEFQPSGEITILRGGRSAKKVRATRGVAYTAHVADLSI